MQPSSTLVVLARYLRAARNDCGKPYVSQLHDILKYCVLKRCFGLQDYFELELFRDEIFPRDEKHLCIGWKSASSIDKKLNHDYWRATANDKLLTYTLLDSLNYPIPATVATFSSEGRKLPGSRRLQSLAALKTYMLDEMPFPVFIKPIAGTFGKGVFNLVGRAAGENFLQKNGTWVSAEAISKYLRSKNADLPNAPYKGAVMPAF